MLSDREMEKLLDRVLDEILLTIAPDSKMINENGRRGRGLGIQETADVGQSFAFIGGQLVRKGMAAAAILAHTLPNEGADQFKKLILDIADDAHSDSMKALDSIRTGEPMLDNVIIESNSKRH